MWIDDNSKRLPVNNNLIEKESGELPCKQCNSSNYCKNNHTACESFLMYVRDWGSFDEQPEDRIPGRVKYNMIFTDKGGRGES